MEATADKKLPIVGPSFDAVVDPDHYLEAYRKETRSTRGDGMPWVWAEAALMAMAIKELRAQLAEAERLLGDLGQTSVELTPEKNVPACCKEVR